jgi:hypothetical protein
LADQWSKEIRICLNDHSLENHCKRPAKCTYKTARAGARAEISPITPLPLPSQSQLSNARSRPCATSPGQ